jgi:hypothetical protein
VKLLEDVTFNKRKMKELEDNLLYKLSATKGTAPLRGNQATAPMGGACFFFFFFFFLLAFQCRRDL